jgi:quercetin dioxygenase-like cupin family protein
MNSSYTYYADLNMQLPEIPADSIVSRTLHNDERIKVTLFGFAPGQELSEHTASQPAILHFIKGKVHLTLGEDEMEAGPGTWVHMPANMRHALVAQTPVTLVLILFK